ncbi:unnamed protein product [Timema podura]|uniref:Protein kinase C and casein kinase substrate in neurons protein 1 n=1 Tax=Timema podura TaxID=61482 RepID=A0ABN7NRD3_TIMPD|nr:unnamed protein product [Timema podura]
MQDRVQKTKEDVQKAKEKYEAALNEINSYNPKYMEDMTEVFNRCQDMEAQRLQFFKNMMFDIHKCLNVSQDPALPQIYEEFYHTVNNADHEKDLKWWSNTHGVNMAMNWPYFETDLLMTGISGNVFCLPRPVNESSNRVLLRISPLLVLSLLFVWACHVGDTVPVVACSLVQEYTEEFRDIAKGKSKEAIPGIMLINQRPVGEDNLHEFPPVNSKVPRGKQAASRVIPTDVTADTKTEQLNSDKGKEKTEAGNRTSTITNGTRSEANPFEEEEWDEDGGDALVDTGEPGVPVKALYDYEGAESDELSFKQGEVFEKLEDEDEQGWCKGRKDGRVGLYPANYVEAVPQ